MKECDRLAKIVDNLDAIISDFTSKETHESVRHGPHVALLNQTRSHALALQATKAHPLGAKLVRFVERRNASQFASNLQFQIDLEGCGLTLDDIGDATLTANGYEWRIGALVMLESGGHMIIKKAERRD